MIRLLLLSTILLIATQGFVSSATSESDSKILFFEDFEAENALDRWAMESTGQGRVRIAEDPRDASNRGLVMDDAVNDAVFSQNIARTTLPIAGFTDVQLSADLYSFNNHVHTVEGFDGIVLRAGEVVLRYSTTWEVEQSFSIDVDEELLTAAAVGDGLLTIELHQYGNFSVPQNGLFFDNIKVTGNQVRSIFVVSPLVTLKSEPLELTVLLDPVPDEDVELTLLRQGSLHGTATYPAEAEMTTLTFPNFDNNTLDGDRFYELAVTDGRFSSSPFYILVQDDTPAGLSLVLPESVVEGETGTGTATVSANRESSLTVALESSDPSIASVPPTVTLPAHSSSVNFPITTLEDPRVLDDRTVTITARVGADIVEQEISITEVNTLMPVLSGPQELTEGDSEVEFTFRLDGISDEELTLVFSADPSEVSIDPESVIVAPGEREGLVQVSVEDDSILQGDRPFTLTVTTTKTGETSTLGGTILDNNIAGFAFSIPEMIEADKNLNLTVLAVNIDGSVVPAFAGSASVFLKNRDSEEEALLVEDLVFAGGEATTNLTLPFSSRGEVLVVRSHENEVETTSVPLSIFANLAFAANDIVYDPERDRLYTVSGGTAISGHRHSLTVIDPDTAEIGEALFIGGDPRNLVITDNHEYVYAGLFDSFAVQRVNLDSFTTAEKFTLDATGSWAGRSYTPATILTVPGRARDFVVGQDAVGSTYTTTRLYLNGVVQPQDRRSRLIVPGGAPDEFYAVGSDLKRMGIISDGVAVRESKRNFMSGTLIAGQNDLLFSDRGMVVDGLKLETIAELRFPPEWTSSFSSPQVVAYPDVDRSRVYYAHGNQIVAYDTGVFQSIASKTIPEIGNISRIIRWGDVGLAVLTSEAQVVLFDAEDLVPTGPATDLSVSITAAPDPVFLSELVEYTATIENIGVEIARDTRLLIELNAGQRLETISAGTFGSSSHGRTVTIEIGDMEPGSSHQFSVTAEAIEVTTLIGTAGALTRSLDTNYANNRASVVLNVGFDSEPESVNVVKIPINEVLLEPVSGDLVVSVQSNAHPGIANHVLAIDPTSGLITRSIPIPAEPGLLALSDDGSTVYALNRNIGYRVDLNTGEIVDTITFTSSFGSDIPRSIVVKTGTLDTLVVGFDRRAGLFVDGNRIAEMANNSPEVVPLPEPNQIFAFNSSSTGFQSYLLEIDENSLSVASTASLFSGFSTRIKSDDYFVYGSDGKGVRADLMTLDGTFSFSEAFSGTVGSLTAFAPDRAGQRIYYARNKEIASFDTGSYLMVRKESFDNLPANITSLERWGDDGFAARLQNDELAIIRTNLVSQKASSIDLLVDLPDGSEVGVPNLRVSGSAFGGQGITGVSVNSHEATTTNAYLHWEAVVGDLAEGENILTITATDSSNPPATRTITRTVYYNPHLDSNGDGLADSWVVEYFGDLDSPQANPYLDLSGDGRNNLTAYLFGTNPFEPDAPYLEISRNPGPNEELRFYLEFIHRASPDWDFVVYSSGDLDNWINFAGEIEQVGEPAPMEGTTNYVRRTYRVTPENGTGMEFLRIQAIRQTH